VRYKRGSMATTRSRRIALTGSHGTGKTTLANALVGHLTAAGTTATSVPEVPRQVCTAAGDPEFFRREKNSLVRQLTLLFGQPVFERRAEAEGPDVVVCDRTALDHWAYTIALFSDELRRESLDQVLAAFICSYMPSYDLIAYIPIEFAPVDDGTREGDIAFQQQIDQCIQDLLAKFAIEHIVVRGTVEDRLAQLLAAIEHLKEQQ
jgi:nicotinamide riboside kinase